MRLSIPIDVWDPRRGGAERYLGELSKSLVARGHEVQILCLRDLSRPEDAPASESFAVETLAVPSRPRWRRELAFAHAAVARHIASGRELLYAVRHPLAADLYQPHGGSYRAAAAAAASGDPGWRRALRRAARRVRPSWHALAWLDREVFRRTPDVLVLSLSAVVEESFRRAYPELEINFRRIPNGISLDRFHDADRMAQSARLRDSLGIAEAPLALFLAHQFRAKGLATAIRALPDAPRWHLLVGGRGDPARYRALAARLGVEDRVRFLGAVDDARATYCAADAFVLPTSYDSCSLSVLEALACGVPALTTRQNGAAELYAHGVEGFILPRPDDARGLADGLEAIANDLEGFRERARLRSRGLGWDRHVDRIEEALREALARPRLSAAVSGSGAQLDPHSSRRIDSMM